MIRIFYNNRLFIILSMVLIFLVGCDSDKNFEIDAITSSDGLNGITQDEIALIDTIKIHQLFNFQIPFDEYKEVYETYYLTPSNIYKMKAYDMSLSGVDDELLLSEHYIGLSIKESREKLKSINVDLDFLDTFNKNRGNPDYKLYMSEIIEGYSEEESMIYVMHEVNIIDEDYDETYTDYFLSQYKFKEVDGKLKIFSKRRIFGFRYFDDETDNHKDLETQLSEFLSRNFIDGEPNYIKEIDLNDLLD